MTLPTCPVGRQGWEQQQHQSKARYPRPAHLTPHKPPDEGIRCHSNESLWTKSTTASCWTSLEHFALNGHRHTEGMQGPPRTAIHANGSQTSNKRKTGQKLPTAGLADSNEHPGSTNSSTTTAQSQRLSPPLDYIIKHVGSGSSPGQEPGDTAPPRTMLLSCSRARELPCRPSQHSTPKTFTMLASSDASSAT